MNLPIAKATDCAQCHRDMYLSTDIFDHAFHISKLKGNDGCADCHQDATQVKTRDTALGCIECHEDMTVADSPINPAKGGIKGFAAGYMDAMHGLCITCHEQELTESPLKHGADFAECAHCHRDIDATRFHRMKPYVVHRAKR